MVEVKVDPGICGMLTYINIDSDDMETANIEITSDCKFVRSIAEELKEVEGFDECLAKLCNTKTYALANEYCRHPGCPIPSAIIKGVEVACGLALPKDVEIKITKE